MAAALAGCGSHPAKETGDVAEYAADYPVYDTAKEIIGTADLIVRGTAIAARVERLYPDVSTNPDPLVNPQAGLSPEELAKWREDAAVVVTVSTVQVTEVLKGSVHAGDQVEVSQLGGTFDGVTYSEQHTTILPSDGSQFVLLLADHGAGRPFDLLNPEQALYEADGNAPLEAVGEDAPLDNETTAEVKAEVAAQK
jgi:hypothetical protein